MSTLKNIWSDLLEKKLWPVAGILVVLIVVVPMQLSSPGEAPVAAAPPVTDTGNDDAQLLTLTRAMKTGFDAAPRVNDKRTDPFAPRDSMTDDEIKKAAETIATAIDSSIGGGGGGGDIGVIPPSDPGLPPVDPEPKPPKVKTVEDDLLSILVQEGNNEPTEIKDIRTLSPLPEADNPFLIYVGPTSQQEAIFMVAADVKVEGEGKCNPTPSDCQTLTLGVGQTADFTLALDNNRTISITMLGIERAKVKEGGEEDGTRARIVGAKAAKRMLADDDVVTSLVRSGVKFARN